MVKVIGLSPRVFGLEIYPERKVLIVGVGSSGCVADVSWKQRKDCHKATTPELRNNGQDELACVIGYGELLPKFW